LETVAELKKLFQEKSAVMPEGMRGFVALDTTTVSDYINEIIHTLFEAILTSK
jgi:multidrug efflux pump subunit AcrB